MTVLYVLLAILLFGILIFVHESGHFLTARLFKVKVNEFSIGMGPKIISKTSKKTGTAYSLRALPIGGFVSMEGEDDASEDEGAFCNKPVWQRMIITAAGSLSNILIGFIVMLIIMAGSNAVSTHIASFKDTAVSDEWLSEGDVIVKVGDMNTYTGNDVVYAVTKYGSSKINVTVLRDGEEKSFDVVFGTNETDGYLYGNVDFYLLLEDAVGNGGFFTTIKHSFFQSRLMIRMVVDSLADLISGKYSIKDLSGPVGVTEVISDAASHRDGTVWLYFVLIAMNLGIVNLLPIPALDGGRLFFMLIELIIRKPVPRKVEAIIHTVGMVLLLGFMLVITIKDVIHLFI
ncbi:MAG: site-2 protease family protein [Clostridia bacterium]|nr:site-2 protease family protein [Clostridia bacterium]MBO4429032.1 site-2 protease family protein [Clostridia bacterium]